MSHIIQCKVEMKEKDALKSALDHLGLEVIPGDSHKLYGGSHANGIAFKLPDWHHPVVVDLTTGVAQYDNYGGSWGKQVELDKLVQRYTIEVAQEESVAGGYVLTENVLENGDVEVELEEIASV